MLGTRFAIYIALSLFTHREDTMTAIIGFLIALVLFEFWWDIYNK